MSALHGFSRDRLRIGPNLWAGVGLVRGGAGTALVGNPKQVAAALRAYMAVGADRFILSGYPHLEEAHRFAELVMPLMPSASRPRRRSAGANTGPFGGAIADHCASGCGGGGILKPVRVAIVGGGFSGAVTAMHLARKSTIPLAIDIIEPRAMLGGGVAYSAVDPAHTHQRAGKQDGRLCRRSYPVRPLAAPAGHV